MTTTDIRQRLAAWISGKAAPVIQQASAEPTYMDLWRGQNAPDDDRLIRSYKNTAYACANLCAQGVAATPLRLYVTTGAAEAPPKCATRKVSRGQRKWLETKPGLSYKVVGSVELEEVAEHPILTLLDAVNAELDGFTLLELTQLYMEVTGEAYWLFERTMGIITAIWVLQSQLVTPVIKDDTLVYYTYGKGDNKRKLAVDDVLPFYMPNLFDPYNSGWSPLRAAYENVNLQEQETAQSQAILDNMARPDFVLIPKTDYADLGDHESTRAKRKIQRAFRHDKSGDVAVLSGQYDIHPLTFSPKELLMAEMAGVTKTNIANAFGVPVSLLQTKDVNLANAKAGLWQFAKFAIVPRTRRMEQRLTQRFASLFDSRLVLAFDDPVPEDSDLAMQARKQDLETGLLSINEGREMIDKDPIPEGDIRLVDSNRIELGEEPPEPVVPVAPPMPPPVDDEDDDTEAQMRILDTMMAHACKEIDNADAMYRLLEAGIAGHTAASWIAPMEIEAPTNCCTDKNPGPYTRNWFVKADRIGHERELPTGKALEAEMEAIFRAQKKATLRQIKAIVLGFTKAETVLLPSDASAMFDAEAWTAKMVPLVEPTWGALFVAGIADAATRLTAQTAAEVTVLASESTAVAEAINAASFEFCAATNATTSLQLDRAIAQLRKEIAEGILTGPNTLPALTKRVAGVFDQAEAYRAERIARTESSRAIHLGQRIEAMNSGVVKGFRWLLSADACPICTDIAASMPEIPLDGQFAKLGEGAYSDIWTPPAHPNCMCSITEILIDEEFTSGGSSGQF